MNRHQEQIYPNKKKKVKPICTDKKTKYLKSVKSILDGVAISRHVVTKSEFFSQNTKPLEAVGVGVVELLVVDDVGLVLADMILQVKHSGMKTEVER